MKKEEIILWLNKYGIKNYSVFEKDNRFVVDVVGAVNLKNKNLNEIPIKFNDVTGFFNVSANKLENLKFAPEYVGLHFNCSGNNIEILNFSTVVNGDVDCSFNKINKITKCPNEIRGFFNCSNNNLENFNNFPKIIGDNLYCNNNKINSLKGISEYIGGDLYLINNELCYLDDCPKDEIDGIIKLENNPIYNSNNLDENISFLKFKKLFKEHKKIIFVNKLEASLMKQDIKEIKNKI